MKYLLLFSFLSIASVMSSGASSNLYFKNFSSDNISSLTSLSSQTDKTPDSYYYYTSKVDFHEGWYLQKVAGDDNSNRDGVSTMVSISRFTDSTTPDEWLVFPKFTVEKGANLYWEARSIHPEALNSYDVMISDAGTERDNYKLLIHVDKENYFFNSRIVSLDDYVGKEVSIAFVNNDPNGYMIALRRLEADIPYFGLKAHRTGHIYFGKNDDKILAFTIDNFGSKEITSLKIVNPALDNVTLGKIDIDEMPEVGKSLDVEIPFEAEAGSAVNYNLIAVYSDGSEESIANDWFNVSDFRRHALVEKFTALWCNNCPRLQYDAHVYTHEIGIDAIYAETHIADAFGCDEYILPIQYTPMIGGDYPSLSINRGHTQSTLKPYERTIFEEAMKEPCTADVKVNVISFDGTTLEAEAEITSSLDIDNKDDFYRVAFILGENSVGLSEKNNPQSNQGFANYYYMGEVAFLPTKYPKDLTVFHKLTRTSSTGGGAGIPNSLPSVIEANKTYNVNWTCTLPDEVINNENMQLTAVFLKFEGNKGSLPSPALNAYAVNINPGMVSAVNPTELSREINESAAPVYYTLQGIPVDHPSHGIFIRVANGKTEKVKIR